ncbi:hypothetical protein DL766_010542 [Monosporascus sp. MC13-8B]|uniref:FAD-binding FR-type domain-containing protein n=1 Tax=Monosporascus cannonballus TaxID=155416 RepID=A0ABY0HHM6_9PEZI|nr:hypothetical protein DL762_001057 [Monosporascus cannonballus]RYP00126.1 hypothetical protein DL763_001055 [Monosporascus cannonballus]RYP02049.1 hypothetical protein DL766_010542 [Monosporascus sp. MC13-8B]
MPRFRGIDVCIIAGKPDGCLNEYPHPDSVSVRLKTVALKDAENEGASNTDPTPKKVNPRVSVYVPSPPGEQFWLRYAITQWPPPSKYIYFKIFMNGHQVSSWGINTTHNVTGSLSRALYKPGDRWKDKYGDIDTSQVGIEARYFNFMLGQDKKSAAEDGGTVEVHVYRANARRPIAPKLDEYRSQERYGIASPSGGLIDNPQDVTYHEYSLIDAKGCPYCNFCFHYRSMKHLQLLSLVPEGETSIYSSKECSPPANLPLPSRHTEYISPPFQQFAFGVESLEAGVFRNDLKSVNLTTSETSDLQGVEGDYVLQSPPKLSPVAPSNGPIPEPCKFPRAGITSDVLQRPLPEIPTGRSRQSSTSSLRSNCPSLTPSLMQYVESDSFQKEDIRLSTAEPAVLIPSGSMQTLELENANDSRGSGDSLSDYDYTASPDCTVASRSPRLPSPEGYLSTTGSILEDHLDNFESPIAQSSPARRRLMMLTSGAECTLVESDDHPHTSTLKLTEAEWLRHSPSPLRRKSGRVERLWSPTPEKRASGSSSENSMFNNVHDHNPKAACDAAYGLASGDGAILASEIRVPPSVNTVIVRKVDQINDQIRLFRLEVPRGGPALRFLPGQWLDVYVPGVPKAGGFTITSAPSKARSLQRPSTSTTTASAPVPKSPGDAAAAAEEEGGTPAGDYAYLELAVQKSPDNPPAAWLWRGVDDGVAAAELLGEQLRVRVGGSFVWPPPGVNARALRKVVFVAGGVGVNPLMSMLSTLAEKPDFAPFEVEFLYSIRDPGRERREAARMLFLDRIASIFAEGRLKGRLRLFLTGGDEAEGDIPLSGAAGHGKVRFRGRRMTADDAAAAVGADRRFAVVYVCGVPAMTDEFVRRLTDPAGLAMEPHRVLCEKWW